MGPHCVNGQKALRKDAAAIILTVETINFGQFKGTFESVLFLKIGIKVGNSVLLRKPLSDFIEFQSILMRADGQSGGKVITT